MEKKAVMNAVNKLMSLSMRMDSRQQILLLITLAYRYSYFLTDAISKGEVADGEIFLKESFIKPSKLVIGYLRANRKIARKIAKELRGREFPLIGFYKDHQDDVSALVVHAVICLFLALVLIRGQSLVKGDWEMVFLYPTGGYVFGFDPKDNESLKEAVDVYLDNELEMLMATVNTVKKKCPVQNHNSLPLTDECIAELLHDASFDVERLFDVILNENNDESDPDDSANDEVKAVL